MKKIIKWCLLGLVGLVAVIVVAELILAFAPAPSKVDHPGVTPEQAAVLRSEFEGPHRTFESSDGEALFLREWRPEPADVDKGTAVLILHGVTAHSGAYAPAGAIIAAGGYTTFGLDYRGHGLSGGSRGDYPSQERWVKDMTEAVEFVQSLGFESVVLLGHSLGVASAIYTAKAIPKEISGLILLSGAKEAKEGVRTPPGYIEMARIMAKSLLRPSLPAVEYFREGMTGLDDPLFNFKYTLRFFRMIDMDELVLPEYLNLPVLVAVGDRDELFAVDKVKELYDVVPGDQKEFLVFKDAYHARIPPESWGEVVGWMDNQFFMSMSKGEALLENALAW